MRGSLALRVGAVAALLAAGVAWSVLARPRASGPEEGAVSELRGASLPTVVERILACRSPAAAGTRECKGVVYVWSERMPLSREGVAEIRAATELLGVRLAVVDASELEACAADLFPSALAASLAAPQRSPQDELVADMLAAGVTVHHPAVLVHVDGRLAGPAILGYKTAAAYRTMVEERVREASPGAVATHEGGEAPAAPEVTRDGRPAAPQEDTGAAGVDVPRRAASEGALQSSRDFPVSGRPGAYFRAVPGRSALAFETSGTIHLLDLSNGGTSVAPGFIDFVPTPDGRFFVTPARNHGGLAFYDAAQVFEAAAKGAGRSVEPLYVDPSMRDQYPSAGILEVSGATAQATGQSAGPSRDGTRTVYRVLTSWFDRIVYRDYEVRTGRARSPPAVRPISAPTVACPQISIPILSQDGRELAGRDEASATTRIFRLGEGGVCQEVADLGLQTGKVAWAPGGKRLAFAIPRGAVRDGSGTLWVGEDDPSLAGIFVYEREGRRLTRVKGSEAALRLAFPEFVGRDSVVFLLSPEAGRVESVFRLVCCVP